MPDKDVISGINWRKNPGWKVKKTTPVVEWDPEAHPQHEYHGAPVEAREGIRTQGLIGSKPWEGVEGYEDVEDGPGVYVDTPPRKDYGPDIWAVKTKVYPSERTVTSDEYIPGNVHVSDVKRVGHWWTNPKTGGQEVHWHKEEQCNGQSVHDGRI